VDKRWPQNAIQKTLYNRTINSSVKLDDNPTDFEIGHMKLTDNKFDLALQDPKAFFAVETPWGIRYTRDGEFTLNSDGEIVSQQGYNLIDQGTGAPITMPQGQDAPQILPDGTVFVGGANIGQIEMAQFTEPEYLEKVGHNLFAAVGVLPELPENPGLVQGFVESSNVDPIMEMVRMVEALRGFEMYQKVVHTYDSLNEQAANNIGRLG
jgi:flagellar basal-body rod protein FlgG